jgi:hypothetical protein
MPRYMYLPTLVALRKWSSHPPQEHKIVGSNPAVFCLVRIVNFRYRDLEKLHQSNVCTNYQSDISCDGVSLLAEYKVPYLPRLILPVNVDINSGKLGQQQKN